jgi:hypothetical protein
VRFDSLHSQNVHRLAGQSCERELHRSEKLPLKLLASINKPVSGKFTREFLPFIEDNCKSLIMEDEFTRWSRRRRKERIFLLEN